MQQTGKSRLVTPKWLPPGQTVRARVRMRLATCEEVGCRGCRTELHKLPAWERPIYSIDGRDCTEDEFIQRLGAGIEALIRYRTRGV